MGLEGASVADCVVVVVGWVVSGRIVVVVLSGAGLMCIAGGVANILINFKLKCKIKYLRRSLNICE